MMKTCLLLPLRNPRGPSPALAETYYVDYAEGRDDASGLSPQSAWKHKPGDAKATGRPQALDRSRATSSASRGASATGERYA